MTGARRLPEFELRGVGVPAVKSAALSPVSVDPPPARNTAKVPDGAGVGPLPSYPLAVLPYPTKSCNPEVVPLGLTPERAVAKFTKATFPTVAEIAIVPVTSGLGKADPLVPPPRATR